MPTLIVVDPGERRFSALCEECMREWGVSPEHGLERLSEEECAQLRIEGDLALENDSATGACRRGHPFRVVREGSEGARH